MLTKKFNRALCSPAFWVGVALLVAGVASNLAVGQQGSDDSEVSDISLPTDAKLLREGTRMEDRPCQCRATSERLIVELEDGRTLMALENLASQRILTAVSDDAGDNHWLINGKVTEFQGRNYLLLERVTRAVRQ